MPLNLIQLERILSLRPRPLTPNRQSHRMSPPPIAAHIPQPPNIRSYYPPQIVLDRHVGELVGQVGDLPIIEGADTGGGVDEMSGHEPARDLGTDAVEGFEGALQERGQS